MATPRFFAPVIAFRLNDGSEHSVTALNPDMLRWEREKAKQGYGDDDKFTMMTYLAWSAAVRNGITAASWSVFQDTCEGVTSDEVEEQDPTRPVPATG